MLFLPLFTLTPEGDDHSPVSETDKKTARRGRPSRLFWVRTAVVFLLAWLVAVMVYHTQKPLPPGISHESPMYTTDQIAFWSDLTYPGPDGSAVHEQQIYKRMGEIIDESREFLVIDMFLFNDYTHEDQSYPPVSQEMTERIIAHKAKYPDMEMVFVSDEVNTNYGSSTHPLFEEMRDAGIQVVITDVNRLRDSTPVYSAVWRTFIQWFGQSGKGELPNLMAEEAPSMTARSYLKLLNVKANHRKVVVSEKTALVASANVHAASAYHSNIAIEAGGEVIADVLAAEQAAVNLSGSVQLPKYVPSEEPAPSSGSEDNHAASAEAEPVNIRYLTEGKVYKYVLQAISEAEAGDVLWMGMFYLAEDKVMNGLVAAAERGVDVRLILDPNQNAFGRDKIGIPNRPAAASLMDRSEKGITVRWYNTGEEQYHTKLMYVAKPSKPSVIIGGSTNFTPRNLKDYNLENNLWVEAGPEHPLTSQLDEYFERQWFNRGAEFTLDVSAYQEETTWLKDIAFRVQKILGFTTF
ncbi:phospholipase D family protein [Paenibacillus lemnae]|uniref:phospholipase D n=1 Tax=Paenibacillus lemnae TaxID=1330551 RepID=A0A848M4E3_PAELE|nr:phospholipase D family protein [Paenibacillus lemnae]NMO94534.1 phospholipase [Paenibacillus lemnae]